MNKIAYVSFVVVVTFTIFSMQSCSSSDDENPTNHFTYNNTDYDLGTQGIIVIDEQATEGVYSHGLDLITPGILYNEDSSTISGKGDVIYLQMNSPSPDKIATGTYQFDLKNTELYNASMGGLVFNIDFDSKSDDDHDEISFVRGSITVKEESGNYEITWTLEDKDGTTITGFFKGNLLKYIPEI